MSPKTDDLPAGLAERVLDAARAQQRREALALRGFALVTAASLAFSLWVRTSRALPAGTLAAAAAQQAVSAGLLLWLLRRAGIRRRHYQGLAATTRAAVGRLHGLAVQQAREQVLLGAALTVVVLPLFTLALAENVAAGRMLLPQAAALLGLFSCVLAGILARIARRVRGPLAERRRQLQALLTQLEG